jgi:hypothetical protein
MIRGGSIEGEVQDLDVTSLEAIRQELERQQGFRVELDDQALPGLRTLRSSGELSSYVQRRQASSVGGLWGHLTMRLMSTWRDLFRVSADQTAC